MQKFFLVAAILSLFSFVQINQPYASLPVNTVDSNGKKDPSHSVALPLNNFESSVKQLYDQIDLATYNLNYDVFRMGMTGYHSLRSEGKVGKKNLLTIIDFTKPSTEKRFYTIDLDSKSVMFHSIVAHGRNTGENMAKTFSNKQHSNQSSLGFYLTGESYVGSKGYSLRLDGQEKEYNGNLRSRAVVIHSADYVSDAWIKKVGRIGRSQGCPALPKDINKEVIDAIKNKTVIFAYFNEDEYLKSSAYLNMDQIMNGQETELADSGNGASLESFVRTKTE